MPVHLSLVHKHIIVQSCISIVIFKLLSKYVKLLKPSVIQNCAQVIVHLL